MSRDIFNAHARATDPQTSHNAAESVHSLNERRAAVLDVLQRYGPMTDQEIANAYEGPDQSPSGLRTRRKELVDMGLVRPAGFTRKLSTGRSANVWEIR